MNTVEFMSYLKELEAQGPAHRLVTRSYESYIHETEVLLHLPQSSWDYADWLVDQGRAHIPLWIMDFESHPRDDVTISQRLMYRLWYDECRRHRTGKPTPTDTPPIGYETWAEPANDW